jgi:hypothetical protein
LKLSGDCLPSSASSGSGTDESFEGLLLEEEDEDEEDEDEDEDDEDDELVLFPELLAPSLEPETGLVGTVVVLPELDLGALVAFAFLALVAAPPSSLGAGRVGEVAAGVGGGAFEAVWSFLSCSSASAIAACMADTAFAFSAGSVALLAVASALAATAFFSTAFGEGVVVAAAGLAVALTFTARVAQLARCVVCGKPFFVHTRMRDALEASLRAAWSPPGLSTALTQAALRVSSVMAAGL